LSKFLNGIVPFYLVKEVLIIIFRPYLFSGSFELELYLISGNISYNTSALLDYSKISAYLSGIWDGSSARSGCITSIVGLNSCMASNSSWGLSISASMIGTPNSRHPLAIASVSALLSAQNNILSFSLNPSSSNPSATAIEFRNNS